MTPTGYLRHPCLQGDQLVFVCDDDLWRVAAAGGTAHRLGAGLSEPSSPALSPDGRWLAYTGRDEQHAEVFVMPAEGGPARRLTWLGADTHVRGWLPDGRILFASNHGQPFFRNLHAFAIHPDGGAPERLPLGQVNHLTLGPGGARVIGRNTADPARWKRYRGGTAGHLWIDADGSGHFRRMSELHGNITCPMWLGGRVYFLSDFEGTGNLYSVQADGSALARHTDHDGFYARNASSDGQRIVYQCAGAVWLFDPASGVAQPVPIGVPGHRSQAARRFVPAAAHLQGVQLHPQGHSLAAEVRGQLFTLPLWEGAVRRMGGTPSEDQPAVRHRAGQWLADGKTLVAASDDGGEPRIECIAPDGSVRALPWDTGRVSSLRAAPRGTRLAIANHRNELLLGDVDSGTLTRLEHSDAGRVEDLAWSPDGAWLACSVWTDVRHRAIKLFEVASGLGTLITTPEFQDWSPSFDPEGHTLAFLSLRTFDPVYDALQFELSFPRAARPYLIALRAGAEPPFEPKPKALKPAKDDAAPRPAAPTAEAAAALQIDLDGIAGRIAPFPVAEARFGQLAFAAGGRVVWSVLPIAGAHGRGGHKDAPAKLEVFEFETLKARPLIERADSFTLGADHHTVLVREGQRLRAIGADHKPSPEADGEAGETPSRRSGWVDLGRIRCAVEPRAEWRQMLREAWRLQRDHFWVADLSGVDWNAVWAMYAPLLERIATRAELSDLMWELQGELGTSHAYEMGGDHRKPPAVALGHLAADLRWAEADAQGRPAGWAIEHLVQGDAWDAGADSPLRAPGVEALVGERIVAIGGQALSATRPPASLLVHQAGQKVELTLAGADGARREVLLTTLADEVPARYREWVERKRAWVHAQSGGRIGYLHVPDMMSAGFAEFHRYFFRESDRDGLVVDLRYNRGGHVSSLLLEKIARRRIGFVMARWARPSPYPEEARAGPVVALTNEHAGSDGDIFSHGFKLMNLGTLVGTRTWGGVIGIWPRHELVDGSTTTQPEYSFWFKDVGWGVENHGTDPQIEVDNAPQDSAAGHDRQLEVALATVQQAIEREGVSRPAFTARPVLARPPLPPRG